MREFITTLPQNIIKCFWGYNLAWQLLAIGLTVILVLSGFDWWYFSASRNSLSQTILFPAVIIGGLLPLILPFFLLALGHIQKNIKTITTAWTVGKAELIALFISSFYKAITGRVPPELFNHTGIVDTSHIFQFGFGRGGIFWGWPSSHTAVAFAIALTVIILYPKHRYLRYLLMAYALYIGLGVSITIHWFSDFIGGAILGIVIGNVVSKNSHQKKYRGGG